MNDDLIRRQAVYNLMRSLTRWCVRSEDGKFNNVGLLYDDVMFGIDRLPSVTSTERTGHWIYTGDYLTEGMLKCSECGEEIDVSESYYDFCPVCGARMVEPQESEVEECR